MLVNAAAAVQNHKNEINDLNVFPVPDGDTGTNMSLTLSAAAAVAAASRETAFGKIAAAVAYELVLKSRGNSGVILSLLFSGLADPIAASDAVNAAQFADWLSAGVTKAYSVVMKPTEGTILTVARLAAAAAKSAAESTADVETVLEAALAAGETALADTINQNPVLKKAGVIDSGGKGFVYILDAMLRALRGETIAAENIQAEPARESADFAGYSGEDITFTYCTEFIVSRANTKDVNAFRAFLDARGDSIVVVDDAEIIKTHVHTNDPGEVLTEALTYGAFLTVKIENMREQHTAKIVESAPQTDAAPEEKAYGVVAVVAGTGLETVFRELGADRLITGGQTMNPSTGDIVNAVNATAAETVFVLPNNSNIIMAAEQAVPLVSKKIVVIPTKTVPQGVSALLAFDPDCAADEIAAAMNDAFPKVSTISVTHAARDSSFDGRDIKAGQYLALDDGGMFYCGESFAELTELLVTRAAAPDFVTIYSGEGAEPDASAALAAGFSARYPDAEVVAVDGGQPVYMFIVSVE
jgi:DAK2 domain fusion protein YloV